MKAVQIVLKALIFLFLFSNTFASLAQNGGLAAYVDFRKRFYVFDKGEKKLLEQQEPRSFKVGGNCVAYVDNADNFKVYQNGEVKELEIGSVRNYEVTEYLVAYSMTDILKVYDNGKVKMLSANTKEFSIGDSLVIYYDYYFNSINAYYGGKIYSQRLRWVGSKIQKIEAGPNTAALITAEDRNFWIFYQGETELINEFVEDVEFKVGQDIVAYMDQPTRTFRAFYKGEIYDIESFQPKSFRMGRGRVAYINEVGDFKTFADGKVSTIASYEPILYRVKDSMIVYQEMDRFMCFYEDKVYEVAPYLPKKYDFQRDLVVYMDRNNNIQIFSRGKTEMLKYGGEAMINDFQLIRDVIILNVGVNKNVIYWKGKIYE